MAQPKTANQPPPQVKAPAADRTVTSADNQPPTRDQQLRAKHPKLFERYDAWMALAKKMDGKVPKDAAAAAKMYQHVRDGMDLLNDVEGVRKVEKEPYFRAGQEVDATFNVGVRDPVTPVLKRIHKAADLKLLEITRAKQAEADAAARKIREAAEAQAQKANERAAAGDIKVAEAIATGAEATHQQADRQQAFAGAGISEASKTVSSSSGLKASVSVDMVCTGVDKATLDYALIAPFIKADVLVAAVNAYRKLNSGAAVKGAILEEQITGRVGR